MDKASVTRLIILIIGVINAGLTMAGYQPIPEGLVNNAIVVATGIYTIYMAWKNNYLSQKGRAQKEVLKQNDLH